MFPSCGFLGKFLWVVLRCMTHITVCHRASIIWFSGVGGGVGSLGRIEVDGPYHGVSSSLHLFVFGGGVCGGRGVLGRIEVYDPYHWASSFLHLRFPGEVSVTCIKLYGQQEEF